MMKRKDIFSVFLKLLLTHKVFIDSFQGLFILQDLVIRKIYFYDEVFFI